MPWPGTRRCSCAWRVWSTWPPSAAGCSRRSSAPTRRSRSSRGSWPSPISSSGRRPRWSSGSAAGWPSTGASARSSRRASSRCNERRGADRRPGPDDPHAGRGRLHAVRRGRPRCGRRCRGHGGDRSSPDRRAGSPRPRLVGSPGREPAAVDPAAPAPAGRPRRTAVAGGRGGRHGRAADARDRSVDLLAERRAGGRTEALRHPGRGHGQQRWPARARHPRHRPQREPAGLPARPRGPSHLAAAAHRASARPGAAAGSGARGAGPPLPGMARPRLRRPAHRVAAPGRRPGPAGGDGRRRDRRGRGHRGRRRPADPHGRRLARARGVGRARERGGGRGPHRLSMLLVLEVGNTNTSVGVFQGSRLLVSWRLTPRREQTADEYGVFIQMLLKTRGIDPPQITGVAISNVVPTVQQTLEWMCEAYFGMQPFTVQPGVNVPIALKVDNPTEVGADRICNVVAGVALYGAPLIVVDFGTATNFDVVNARGEFVGGGIAPGLMLSSEALISRAARLFRVELVRPKEAIGRNTATNIQSGVVYGYAGLVDGLVERMRRELDGDPRVVATGGLAGQMRELARSIQDVNANLRLEGLRMIWRSEERRVGKEGRLE